MDELVQWLLAQLDEDAAEAQEALKRTTTTRRRIGGEWVEDTVQPPEWRRSVWGPARVLREIDAKRQVLRDLEQAEFTLSKAGPGTPPHDLMTGAVNLLRRTVRLHAEVYDQRPGYREEWRP